MTYEEIRELVYNRVINKTDNTPYEELSEKIFGEGNCFNESEVRKRLYGMKRLIEIIESDKNDVVANRILAISDTHIPYNLPIETFADYVGKVDSLVLNGDILDCQSLSSFPKKYRISFMEELICARQYMIDLIEYVKPKKVYINYGNHDSRMGAYLASNLDSDILELLPDNPLDLILETGFSHYDKRNKTKVFYEPLKKVMDNYCIIYSENWWQSIGETIFCHPKAFSNGILKTTEKALQHFNMKREYPECIVMAHTHRLGMTHYGDAILIEQGTCSDVSKLDYMDGKLSQPQQMGFVYLCQDENGKIIKDKIKLVKI